MTDREQADGLARELVASGWHASLYFHWYIIHEDGSLVPDLLQHTTAAVLAVQAMEAGALVWTSGDGRWYAHHVDQSRSDASMASGGHLGIVAAKALIALRRTT